MRRGWIVAAAVLVLSCSSGSGPGGAAGTGGGAGAGGGGMGGAAGARDAGVDAPGCSRHDLDIQAVPVSGLITVNGSARPDAGGGSGTVSIGTATGDNVLLGSTAAGSYSTLLIPGTYDLTYAVDVSGGSVPVNALAKIRSGVVIGAGPVTLNVDVPLTSVSGKITVNGAALADATNGDGKVLLRDASGNDAPLGQASDGSYTSVVVPGTYDVYYEPSLLGTAVPANQTLKLQAGVVVGPGPTTLDVDIPSSTVSGNITLQGMTVIGSPLGIALLMLVDPNDITNMAVLGTSEFGSYSAGVAPGTYDLYYSNASNGIYAPANARAKLRSGVVVGTSPLALDVDVVQGAIEGKITINGAVVSGTANGQGILMARDADGNGTTIGDTSSGTYAMGLVPGTYDVLYKQGIAGSGVPANSFTKIRSGVVVSATTPSQTDIDIQATPVSGAITVNGATVTGTAAGNGRINFYDPIAGGGAPLGSITGGPFSVLVIPGTYNVNYSNAAVGTGVPLNTFAVLRTGVVVGASPLTLDVDLQPVTVCGAITVNGAVVPAAQGIGSVFLENTGALFNVPLGATTPGSYSIPLLPGSFEAYYGNTAAGAGVPANGRSDLGPYPVP